MEGLKKGLKRASMLGGFAAPGAMAKGDVEISYVPRLVVRHVQSCPIDSPLRFCSSDFPAAVLFADISGFTPLTEKLSKLPSGDGAEQLLGALNTYFGRMVALISASGGDVLKFAGDALLVVWPVLDAGDSSQQLPKYIKGSLSSLGMATTRACQCALQMQEKLDNFEASEGIFLRLHTGVGAGRVYALHVGGVAARWEFLIAGQPLLQIASAEGESKSGECVVSAEAWDLVSSRCRATVLPSGNVLLHQVVDSLPKLPVRLLSPEMPQAHVNALRMYIPEAVRKWLELGQMQWLGELRRVTVLFISLTGLDGLGAEEIGAHAIARVQTAFVAVQQVLLRHEALLRQFLIEDKGCTLIAACGLPPLAHHDDACRGVLTALAIREVLNALDPPVSCSIGVTTGRVFCGAVGSHIRREYAMIGDVVNLSARLMGKAGPDGILCDEPTHKEARRSLSFEELPPVQVKGKLNPIAIFRPVTAPHGNASRRRTASSSSSDKPLFGRETAMASLLAAMDKARRDTHQCLEVAGGGWEVRLQHNSSIRSDDSASSLVGSPLAKLEVGLDETNDSVYFKSDEPSERRLPTPRVVIVSGDAGIGKSSLIRALQANLIAAEMAPPSQSGSASSRVEELEPVLFLHGAGDLAEESTPFYCFRDVLLKLIDLHIEPILLDVSGSLREEEGETEAELRTEEDEDEYYKYLMREAVVALLKDERAGASIELASLLNPVLPFAFPETDAMVGMSDGARADNLHAMLCYLFDALCPDMFKLIILENAHHLDPASWALIRSLGLHMKACAIVLAMRPVPPDKIPAEYDAFRTALRSSAVEIHLGPLSEPEMTDLVDHLLADAPLPAAARKHLIKLVEQRAQGNPLFVELNVQAVRESRMEEVQHVPNNMLALITSVVDRCDALEQVILKTASVIGHVFNFDVLCAIFPDEKERPMLRPRLERLRAAGILVYANELTGERGETACFTSGESSPLRASSVKKNRRTSMRGRGGNSSARRNSFIKPTPFASFKAARATEASQVLSQGFERTLQRNVSKLNMLRCTRAMSAVSDIEEERYAFKHTVMQEVVYKTLPLTKRRQLHRALAEHLEGRMLGGSDPALLLHHWRAAEVRHKVRQYLEEAASASLRCHANAEAAAALEECAELTAADSQLPGSHRKLKITSLRRRIGYTYLSMGNMAEAMDQLKQAVQDAAVSGTRKITRFQLFLPLAKQKFRQYCHRSLPHVFMRASDSEQVHALMFGDPDALPLAPGNSAAQAERLERLLALEGLIAIHLLRCDLPRVWYGALRFLNGVERRTADTDARARGLAYVAEALQMLQRHKLMDEYADTAIKSSLVVDGTRVTSATVRLRVGRLHLGMGRWARASELLEEAVVLFKRFNNKRQADMASHYLCFAKSLQSGKPGVGADGARDGGRSDPFAVVVASARRRRDRQMQGMALSCAAAALLQFGDSSAQRKAGVQLDELRELTRPASKMGISIDVATEINYHALLAVIRLRRNELGACKQSIGRVSTVIKSLTSFSLDAWPGIAALAEASLGFWHHRKTAALREATNSKDSYRSIRKSSKEPMMAITVRDSEVFSADGKEIYESVLRRVKKQLVEERRIARDAVESVRRFSLVYPIGRPRFLAYRGMLLCLEEQTQAAKRVWMDGVAAADELGMPFERALCDYLVIAHCRVSAPSLREAWQERLWSAASAHFGAAVRLRAPVGALREPTTPRSPQTCSAV